MMKIGRRNGSAAAWCCCGRPNTVLATAHRAVSRPIVSLHEKRMRALTAKENFATTQDSLAKHFHGIFLFDTTARSISTLDSSQLPKQENNGKDQYDKLRERTNIFLDLTKQEPGITNEQRREEGIRLLQLWTTLPPSHPLAGKSVATSIAILELSMQIIGEEIKSKTTVNLGSDRAKLHDMLSQVLGHWELCLRRRGKHKKERLPTPGQMLARLHQYRSQLPYLLQTVPTTTMSNLLLQGLLTATTKQSGHREESTAIITEAMDFLKEMIELQKKLQKDGLKDDINGNGVITNTCAPNTKTFDLLLQICVQAGSIQSTVDILDFLLLLERNEDASVTAAVRLSSSAFEKLFRACTKSTSLPTRDRGRLADLVMERMNQCYEGGVLTQRPEVAHYTYIMNAWAKSQHPDSSKRCMEILQYLRNANKKWLEPDAYAYTAVLDSLANLGAANEAEAFLESFCHEYHSTKQKDIRSRKRMEPNTTHFNIVLNAWANSKERNAGECAENLLRFMQRQFIETRGQWNSKPDLISYNSTIRAWGVSRHPMASQRAELLFQEMLDSNDDTLKPDTRLCAAMLHTWAKDGNVKKAAKLLGYMCTEFETEGNTHLEPNIQCFAVLLDAFAKSKQPLAGPDAEAFLRRMASSGRLNMTPTTFCYNSVINAYARSGSRIAGQEAERLLREMSQQDHDRGGVGAPDLVSYNSTMNAYARSKKASDAERLLRELQSICKENPRLTPNILSFNCVLNAYAKNGNPEKAESILLEMRQQPPGGVKPNVFSLSSVLEAWSRSGSPKAGEKADMYLEIMEAYPEKERMELRYRLAHMCWRNSLGCDPRAGQRMKELSEILTKLQKGKKRYR